MRFCQIGVGQLKLREFDFQEIEILGEQALDEVKKFSFYRIAEFKWISL